MLENVGLSMDCAAKGNYQNPKKTQIMIGVFYTFLEVENGVIHTLQMENITAFKSWKIVGTERCY